MHMLKEFFSSIAEDVANAIEVKFRLRGFDVEVSAESCPTIVTVKLSFSSELSERQWTRHMAQAKCKLERQEMYNAMIGELKKEIIDSLSGLALPEINTIRLTNPWRKSE